ncbi:MAG: MarR family EPS-associated transcriptional regulator [Actinobacteria bacterium]|nr:MarR family EPS-associated transcriptional regulator [Actinomycetota bacterium]
MDEHSFKTLKELSDDNTLSQRDISKRLGVSIGKVNYIINALIEKGYIKAVRFKNSKNKIAYMYVLTPNGVREKIRLTQEFIKRKTEEYNFLEKEIEELKKDIDVSS